MTHTDENCIFCKLIKKEIPSYLVYEDDITMAFLDLSQTTKGHTLLIPKTHVSDVFSLDEKLASQLFARVPKIALALEKTLPTMNGLNIVNNNRELAYQSVFHAHIHLIPRYSSNDDFSIHFGNHSTDYSSEALVSLAAKIQQQVN